MQCTRCRARPAALRIDAAPACTPCLIGALCIEPDVVFPYYDMSVTGMARPDGAAAALGLENMPSAADLAAELLALADMDARARADMLVAIGTRILSILGPRQYGERAYDAFVADMRKQVVETRAVRLVFVPPVRPLHVDFVALSLAIMYAAWIGRQEVRVRQHMQVVDMLVTVALGARRATAVEEALLVPLGPWAPVPTADDVELVEAARTIDGEITPQRLDAARSRK